MRAHPPLRIAQVLHARGITNRDLAERLGITENWLGQVVNGRKEPSVALARLIAYELGVPENELFAEAVAL